MGRLQEVWRFTFKLRNNDGRNNTDNTKRSGYLLTLDRIKFTKKKLGTWAIIGTLKEQAYYQEVKLKYTIVTYSKMCWDKIHLNLECGTRYILVFLSLGCHDSRVITGLQPMSCHLRTILNGTETNRCV